MYMCTYILVHILPHGTSMIIEYTNFCFKNFVFKKKHLKTFIQNTKQTR